MKLMRPFFFLLILFLAISTQNILSAQHQQWFKTISSSSEDIPEWARLMYLENPNVRMVDSAYLAYYRTNEFVKNTHTQNYKHWRPKVEPYLDSEGFIHWPDAKTIRQQEQAYQATIAQSPSHRFPANWQNLGPFETYNQGEGQFAVSWQANVYTIDQADTDPAVLYCGTESGGVFKTTDSGQSWQHVSANTMMNNVRIVRVDPNDADIAYAGDWNRVYRTTDGGLSWEVILDAADVLASGLGVNAIAVSPADGNKVIVAGEEGLWYTDDGGQSWNYQFANSVYDIEFQPGNSEVLYLVRNHESGVRCEFLKSENGGLSWEVKDNGWYLPVENAFEEIDRGAKLAVSPLNPNLIIAGLVGDEKPGDEGYLGVWKSEDAGESWSLLGPHVGGPYEYSGGPATHKNIMRNEGGGGPYQGFYDYVLAISPFDTDIIYIGGVSFYKSTDGGATFNVIGGYQGNTWIHPDMQELTVGADGIWLANDGGVDFSSDEFATAESRKYGITASEFWGFSNAWNEDLLVGGRYHNGNTAIRPEFEFGRSLRLGGAEAPTGYVQPGGRSVSFFSDIAAQIVPHSLDGSVLQVPSLSLYPSESYFAAHSSELEFTPYCYNHFYIGRDNQLWKSEDGGRSFEAIGTFGTENQPVMQFEVSRTNPEVIYVYQRTSFYGAHLWKTTDAGASWEMLEFPSGPGSMRAGGLALKPEDENELWVFFAHQNNDGAKIYRTTDGGQSWENRTTDLLDGHSIRTMLYQAGTDGSVYIGTDKAVFHRNNSMDDWELFNQGLPMRMNANLLRPFYKESKLRLGSYSNGVWETPFAEPSGLIVQPTVDKLVAGCSRDTFYFDDYSVLEHEGASWTWTIEPAPAYISDANTRNPKVVFGTEGEYQASLTVTNGNGLTGSKALPLIRVEACRVDTIPGMALEAQEFPDYAAVEGLPVVGNEVTITAWVKPAGIQNDYTGILISDGGATAGLNFRPNMELGYHWPGGAWSWSSGLTVPADEWSYVAMVVQPDRITLYLNGQPAIHQVNPDSINWTNKVLHLGSYRGWVMRNYNGLLDEVKVYKRALSTEEIRLNRHLTGHAEEEGLVAYYQFNEMDGGALNKAGTQHAGLNGNAGRTLSTAAVGSGKSAMKLINSSGTYSFDSTGIRLDFGNAGLPEGPVVATRLNIPPDVQPGNRPVPDGAYWIINGYGSNDQWSGLNGAILSGFNLPPAAEFQPEIYQLYQRPENAEGNSWTELAPATLAIPEEEEGVLAFGNQLGQQGSGQLIIDQQGELVSINAPALPHRFVVYPNPVRRGSTLQLSTNDSEAYTLELFDKSGKCIFREKMKGNMAMEEISWPAGSYAYRIQTADYWLNGRLIVVD